VPGPCGCPGAGGARVPGITARRVRDLRRATRQRPPEAGRWPLSGVPRGAVAALEAPPGFMEAWAQQRPGAGGSRANCKTRARVLRRA